MFAQKSSNKNPLQYLKRSDWTINYNTFSNVQEFYKSYEANKLVVNKADYKVIRITHRHNNCGYELVKIYNTGNKIQELYKQIVFIRETKLMEYSQIYYNPKTSRCYIRQPMYSKSLGLQMHSPDSDCNLLNNENKVKFMISDILHKIWLIHNCGYCYCDIEPYNIVKRNFKHQNKGVTDGWKLIDFNSMKKYKSKGEYVGSPGWTSPEMVYGSKKNKYIYESDIFSLGLIILFALFGNQPLEISENDKEIYGQNIFANDYELGNYNAKTKKRFENDLKNKMYTNWYNKLLKSENKIKNYLIQLYFNGKISLNLFKLLYVGMLIYDPLKRWNCEKIYQSEWFTEVRRFDNKKKLRIKVEL